MGFARRLLVLFAALIAVSVPSAAIAAPHSGNATASRLVTGLQGGSGSTIGPDRALYVTETAAGKITRVDPKTGATTTYAGARMPFTLRTRDQILDLFDGFDLVEPGLVSLPEWRPDLNTDRTPLNGPTVGAVARLAA